MMTLDAASAVAFRYLCKHYEGATGLTQALSDSAARYIMSTHHLDARAMRQWCQADPCSYADEIAEVLRLRFLEAPAGHT